MCCQDEVQRMADLDVFALFIRYHHLHNKMFDVISYGLLAYMFYQTTEFHGQSLLALLNR